MFSYVGIRVIITWSFNCFKCLFCT